LQRRFAIEAFDNIKNALDYTVQTLIAKRRGYIVNVLGSEEAKAGRAATVQVVAQDMVLGNGEPGLAVHLPFDPQSGQFPGLVRFLETELAAPISEYKYKGIPCFFATFGTEVDRADRAILQLLVQVTGYSPSAEFACEVHDEGPLSTAGCHWALQNRPPRGASKPAREVSCLEAHGAVLLSA
jgi:hypothetical protein